MPPLDLTNLRKAIGAPPPQEQQQQQMITVPVSVNLIVKNCAESLDACLRSLKTFILDPRDELIIVDTGSTDKGATVRVARQHGAKVIERPDLSRDMSAKVSQWLPGWEYKYKAELQNVGGMMTDFAEARQIALRASRHDCVFWIDSDDTLWEARPGELRMVVEQGFKKRFDALFLEYEYAFDKHDGRCITTLKRERVVDKRMFYWKGRCHETLIPRVEGQMGKIAYYNDVPVKIRHTAHRVDHRKADIRNYIILRNELEDDRAAGRVPDTRTLFYIGNSCRGLGLTREGLGYYKDTMRLSGSADDRYAAQLYMAQMYLTPPEIRPLDAVDAGLECIKLSPRDPRGHFIVSRAYALMERWEEALQWFEAGQGFPMPETTHTLDPEQVISFPLAVAIKAAVELGRIDHAKRLAEELIKRRPDYPDTKAVTAEVQNAVVCNAMIQGIQALVTNSKPGNQAEAEATLRKIVDTLAIVPDKIEDSGAGKSEPPDSRPVAAAVTQRAEYKNEAGERVVELVEVHERGRDLALWCGHTFEPWGRVNRKTGISGSEKMVLLMVPHLQARGFRTTVYANVPHVQRGRDASGVHWRHWSEFDRTQPRDILMVWRQIGALAMQCPARRRVAWLHDVQNPGAWAPELCASADDVWCLSESHAAPLRGVAGLKGKIWVTRNAIDGTLYTRPDATLRRNRNKVIFCSDITRGALTAIRAFRLAIQSGVPAEGPEKPELHIFYGFSKLFWGTAKSVRYVHVPDKDGGAWLDDYVREFWREVDRTPGVFFHGRVSWAKLASHFRTAGVWLYPTRFIETSCMSAMEAAAAGCCTVTSRVGALQETVDWDDPLTFQTIPAITDAGAALYNAMQVPADYPSRLVTAARAVKRFNAADLANEWAARLVKDD